MIGNGLKPLSLKNHEDNKPYSVGGFLTLPQLSEIEDSHIVSVPSDWVLNQQETEPGNDECAGAASSISASLLDGQRDDPHFVWMVARARSGAALTDFGASNQDMALAYAKVGALKWEDCPYSFKTPRNIIADETKWDMKTLLPKAIEQRKASPLWIRPIQGMDAYDTWRASITALDKLYPGRQHTAVFGMLWSYDQHNPNIDKPVDEGTGHDTVLLGWRGGKAVQLNSLGVYAGDNGRFYLSREVVNKWAVSYGMFVMLDLDPSEIKYMLENNLKLDDNWLASLIKPFLVLLADLLRQLKLKLGMV